MTKKLQMLLMLSNRDNNKNSWPRAFSVDVSRDLVANSDVPNKKNHIALSQLSFTPI